MNKLTSSIKEAVINSGLRDGMTVSFHHHLRNGDYVLNMVMEAISELGIRDLTVNASSLFDTHRPMKEHIKNGTVKSILTDYMSGELGRFISAGGMNSPVQFRTHGGRPCDIENGKTPIDVAFIAAPASDPMGNCTGKRGKSACGSLGYAIPDARNARHTVVITDELVPYPLIDWSIPETDVDQVVLVDSIGDPKGIVSGTTKITRDPIGLSMAMTAVDVIKASGLLKDGFSFQTGAGGASLAAAKYLKDVMLKENIRGSYGLGGITGYMVDMLNEGCFESLLDVQCFDLKAVESIRNNPKHRRNRDRYRFQCQCAYRFKRQDNGRQRRTQRYRSRREARNDNRTAFPCKASHRHRSRHLHLNPRLDNRCARHPKGRCGQSEGSGAS